MLPYCLAGAIVAGVTVITLLGVDASLDVLDESGTLDYPFGYRNANAAFFAGVALTALAVGARRGAVVPGALGGRARGPLPRSSRFSPRAADRCRRW